MQIFDQIGTEPDLPAHSLSSYYNLLQPEIHSLERLVEAAPLPLSERGELAQIIAIRFANGANRAFITPAQ